MVKHVLGISGGKDSAALAIYLKQLYPELPMNYYNADTGCELEETIKLINSLESIIGPIDRLVAAKGSPEDTPFDHFLKVSGGYLPSPQARWCTQKMKLGLFEDYVQDEPTISYVGIRGDEEREGYISTKPNIQSIFPFRRNIWSVDVINLVLNNKNLELLEQYYIKCAGNHSLEGIITTIRKPIEKKFFYTKKLNMLLDYDVKLFNHVVFSFLKTTDYPVGKLDNFPLIDNEEVLVIDDIFSVLEESGVGVPKFYLPIEFEVDGQKGYYKRSRSGCYFCFFQQKIEWVWLLEQHPDLFKKAMDYEKDGYTWSQSESLSDLSKPDRVNQIKRDIIRRQESILKNHKKSLLIDLLDGEDDVLCGNCFI